jgi:(hydroxyamino)benzene mutase
MSTASARRHAKAASRPEAPPSTVLPLTSPVARRMAHAAAWLMLVGLLTGGYVSAAMTGKVPADPQMALAAHLNALMGTFFLLGVAWTLPMLSYGPVGQLRLAWAVIVANWANWAITCVKAWLRVSGVDLIGQPANDAVFGALTLTVVLPALVAAGAWVYGFRRPAPR